MTSWKLCTVVSLCVAFVLVTESESQRVAGRRSNNQDTQGNSNNCIDDYGSISVCNIGKRHGWCATGHEYYAQMSQLCPKTCGLCHQEGCQDDMPAWYCSRYSDSHCQQGDFVWDHCKVTCGNCQGGSQEERPTRLESINICRLPRPLNLPCTTTADLIHGWFFSHRTGSCEFFYHGRCPLSNANRFANKDDCVKACDGPAGGVPPRPNRPTEEQSAATMDRLSGSINKFTIDIHREMMNLDDVNNFVISPFSIYNAMGMASVGAAGRTKQEIVTALGMFPQVHQALSAYNTSLALADSENTTLSMANAMYLRPGVNIKRRFENKMREAYKTSVHEFRAWYPEEPINNWVEQMTNGEIKDLLQDGTITVDTIMVLINAIYFKGKWKTKFDEEATERADFKVSETETADVEMMLARGEFNILQSRVLNATVLELPYEGERYVMTIILPDVTTNLRDVISRLNRETLDDVVHQLEETNPWRLLLRMPKFALDTKVNSLVQLLETLGINHAFGYNADFSKMTSRPVSIDNVIHKAIIEVDEEGTVAAAATAIVIGYRMAGNGPPMITVDRPFMFMIRDVQENVCLFSGQFVDPNGDVKMD